MRAIILIISIFISLNFYSQDKSVKSVTINVKGNCDQCKTRIENAADIKGVKLCVWDEKTKVAKIKYDTAKVSLNQIEKAIAKVGHDTDLEPASKESYKKLPKCCQYNDAKCDKK